MIRLPLSRSGRTALEVASQAADEAGSLLIEHMHGERQLSYKEGRANIVTEVDVLVEKKIIGLLQNEFPEHNILSEESPAVKNDSHYTWVVDPLDGTNNYAYGIPVFTVAIALMSQEEVLLGLTYDPVRRELFVAQKGSGASLNGRPISVSRRDSMERAFIGYDLGYDREAGAQMLDTIRAIWPRMAGLRILGSAVLGLAYVACGRFDLYLHRYLYPWDMASGILLVREAGGEITDWAGKPVSAFDRQIIAGNKALHGQMLALTSREAQLGLERP
ncbi:MAG: inositol monophosphatase [Chloroflexi bacterium]|nr:inositol monophosphatase [Chloroflexota bacterium]